MNIFLWPWIVATGEGRRLIFGGVESSLGVGVGALGTFEGAISEEPEVWDEKVASLVMLIFGIGALVDGSADDGGCDEGGGLVTGCPFEDAILSSSLRYCCRCVSVLIIYLPDLLNNSID